MRKFILKLTLFSLPFVLWFGLVAWVDPFNFFQNNSPTELALRESEIRPLNSMLFNMIKYKNAPCEVVFIGDSRTRVISDSLYSEITHEPTFNLYSNKAKLNEMIDLFWFAERFKKLKKVYFGINFNLFNTYAFGSRSKSNSELCSSPLKYITNRAVGEATGMLLHIFSMPGEKKPNQVDFWKYNLETKANDFYSKYDFPEEAVEQLLEVSKFCAEYNIELTFVIVPHVSSMQKKVPLFHLEQEELNFKHTISGIANTVDYDYNNAVTSDTTNFGDPIHFKKHIGELIARELASKDFQIGQTMHH